jgi:hypothetical protein
MNSYFAHGEPRSWFLPVPGLVTLLLAFVLIMPAAGCASRMAEFRPPRSIDVGPPNAGAAYYTLDVGGRHVGDAKVWTHGIKDSGKPDKAPSIQVGLRIRDDGTDPVRVDLDTTEVEVQTRDGNLFFQKASSVTGNSRIDPRSTGRLLMAFNLPAGVSARDVTAFEFNWTVESGDLRLSKSTPFFRGRIREHDHYYFVDPAFMFYHGWGWPRLSPFWWW